MIKYVTVSFGRAGMGRKEFSSYWKDTHAPLLKEMPELRGYVQNRLRTTSTYTEPTWRHGSSVSSKKKPDLADVWSEM
jgi:uncharacterized protein (TIGR02118 family)